MTTIPTPTPPTRPSDYSFDNVFKLWSKYEDVTMHFNDLILKLRFQALAGVAGLSAVAGLFGREISEGIRSSVPSLHRTRAAAPCTSSHGVPAPRSGIPLVTLFSPVPGKEFGPKRVDLAPHLASEPLDLALDVGHSHLKPLSLRCPTCSQPTAVAPAGTKTSASPADSSSASCFKPPVISVVDMLSTAAACATLHSRIPTLPNGVMLAPIATTARITT